ncbi:MAG TPA: PKD domain-containing protein, partial [Cytophagales bacterium]|nr:PKD domain-containing protein [Cytophagales bacterium]
GGGSFKIKDLVIKKNSVVTYYPLYSESSTSIDGAVLEDNNFQYGGCYFTKGFKASRITAIRDTIANQYPIITVFSDSSATIDDMIYKNNVSSATYGGSIYFEGKDLEVSNSIFNDNRADNGYTQGFGITCKKGNLKAVNCRFENNRGTPNYLAGGIYFSGNSTTNLLTVEKCIFYNNHHLGGSPSGLAVYGAKEVLISDCEFKGNTAKYSGAVEMLSIGSGLMERCKFISNRSLEGSGGALNIRDGNIKINECEISRNFAKLQGGGISYTGYDPLKTFSLQIFNSSITQDSAGTTGGGLYAYLNEIEINNSLIVDNYAAELGGGIYNNASKLNLKNITIANNTNKVYTYGEQLWGGNYTLTNSIVRGTGKKQNFEPNYKDQYYVFKYSDIQGGAFGEGNIDVDPLFVDPSSGNYRLTCASPLINIGSNHLATQGLDLDGKPRVYGGNVDLGAYEFPQDPASASTPPSVNFTLSNDNPCKSEVISFTNSTSPLENTRFEWNFGNGSKSQEQSPSYAYVQSGTYTITLKATNACGANATVTKQLTIKPSFAPTIDQATVVCPGKTSEFSTNVQCSTLTWSVAGGVIMSGQGTNSIKIQWGDGSTGNGKVTLNVDGCGADYCNIPVSVEIPIVPTVFNVQGNTKSCQNGVE